MAVLNGSSGFSEKRDHWYVTVITTAHEICERLRELEISFTRFDHPPVATCEDANKLLVDIPGVGSKNLFLRNKKGDRYVLVTVADAKRVDIAAISVVLGLGRLSFASAERLHARLGVLPGAVSILGVINDVDGLVDAYVDRELWESDGIQCHPLENTSTLVMSPSAIERALASVGRSVSVIDVPSL